MTVFQEKDIATGNFLKKSDMQVAKSEFLVVDTADFAHTPPGIAASVRVMLYFDDVVRGGGGYDFLKTLDGCRSLQLAFEHFLHTVAGGIAHLRHELFPADFPDRPPDAKHHRSLDSGIKPGDGVLS